MITSRTFDTTTLSTLLAALKASIRITSSDLDTELTFKLKSAIENAEKYVGGMFAKSVIVEEYSFHTVLELDRLTIAVSGVVVDGVALSQDQFSINGRTLTIDDSVEGDRVAVTSTRGLTYLPYDLQAAVVLAAAYLFNNPVDAVKNLPTRSETLLAPFRYGGIYGD